MRAGPLGTIVLDAAAVRQGGGSVAIEMTGGEIVNERGTVVTFRQRCEECGYVLVFARLLDPDGVPDLAGLFEPQLR